jgi:hypothetical protein
MIIEYDHTWGEVDDRAVKLFHSACRSLGHGDIKWIPWSAVILGNGRPPILRLRDLRNACIEAARQYRFRRRLPLSVLGDLKRFVEVQPEQEKK